MRKKYKQFEPVTFCELAISKDKSRFNLCSVYRDKDRFVGCDGHRLHWVTASKIENAYFLGGEDGDYPDYTQVIPSETFTTAIIPAMEDLTSLKALDSALKSFGKIREVTIKGYAGGEDLLISSESKGYLFKVLIPCKVKRDIEVSVNLPYLIDALSMVNHSEVAISFKDTTSPLMFSSDMDAFAVVMPLRSSNQSFKGIWMHESVEDAA